MRLHLGARLHPRHACFVQAVHESSPSVSVELIRDEKFVLERVAQSYPIPALVHAVEACGWIVLVSEAVPGIPLDENTGDGGLRGVMNALHVLQQRVVPDEHLPSVAERYDGLLDHTAELLSRRPELAAGATLAEVSSRAEEAVRAASVGNELVHGDLRGDNVLVDSSGSAWLVDWAWGCRGRAWADSVTLMCSVREVSPERRWAMLTEHPVTAGASVEDLHGYVDPIAALYDSAALRPDPPGLPSLRGWQREQARSAMDLSLAATKCEGVR